jgi:hypothetical protein
MSKVLQHAVDVLNRALAADPDAINALFAHRAPCNDELAHDPDVMVRAFDNEPQTVGLLGVINGCIGGDKVIAMEANHVSEHQTTGLKIESFQVFDPTQGRDGEKV